MATDEKSTRTYRGKAAGDRSSERREKLIDAGHQLFGTQGYSATTVKQLCVEAGLTERYFYESFENREALFTVVATRCVAGLASAIIEARSVAPETPEAQIDALMEAFFVWFEEDPRRTRIQLYEPLLISPAFQTLYRDVTALFVTMMRDAVVSWYDDAIRCLDLDADLLSAGLVGCAIETVKEWAHTGYARPRAEVVRNTRFMFRAMSNGLRDATSSR